MDWCALKPSEHADLPILVECDNAIARAMLGRVWPSALMVARLAMDRKRVADDWVAQLARFGGGTLIQRYWITRAQAATRYWPRRCLYWRRKANRR